MLILLFENVLAPSPSRHHELAVQTIRRGAYASLFWGVAIAGGGLLPLALVALLGLSAPACRRRRGGRARARGRRGLGIHLGGSGPERPAQLEAGGRRAAASGRRHKMSEQQRGFRSHPDPSEWDNYVDYESTSWPKKDRRGYWIIPTICFNCESACGLLAYVDKQSMTVRKVEGNPVHPGSRGRTCAKGVVTPNQLEDPDRILYPLKRAGARGEGRWERVSWEAALTEIGGRIRSAIVEGRRHELMYHVGRPGEDGYTNRVLQAWGIDGHNSHTNVCSSSARLGHFLWTGADRPSPDYANARTILLLSSHLETGHYFNPHAQRIMEAQSEGATIITIDPRLSNTSAKANLWLPAYSGTEGALLLAIVRILLAEDLYDRDFVRSWVNWEDYLRASRPGEPATFERFIEALEEEYAQFTPEYAEQETGVPAERIVAAARAIARAGSRFSTHSWRAAAAGNLWGWQITRCLYMLVVLTGSVGSVGGVNLHVTNKFVPKHPNPPPAPEYWNELLFPREFPLAFHELSYLLPHFLKEGRGRLDVYFTRVYNPVWTNPDGFSWMEVLQDPAKIGLHVVAVADMERDGVVRRLHPAHGARHRAPRHDELGDPCRPVARIPAARAPGRPREERRNDFGHARSQSGRGVGGSRVLGGAQLEDRS